MIKKIIILVVIALFTIPAFSQNLNNLNNLTPEEIKAKFLQYEQQMKEKYNVIENKENFIVPLEPEIKRLLESQKEVSFYNYEKDLNRSSNELKVSYYKLWGREDRFAAYIDALAKIYGSKLQRSLDSHFYAGGYVFNYHKRIIEATIEMKSVPVSGHVNLKIFGKTKFDWKGSLIYQNIFYNTGEIGKDTTFMIGPVPVTVYGGIGGKVGLDASLSVVYDGIQGKASPWINSYGRASAAVGVSWAKAGVEGSLVLLNDKLPITLTNSLIPGRKIKLALKVQNQLDALSGKINVFVKVKALGFEKKYTKVIFSWSGFHKSWVLYNRNIIINY